MDLRKLKTLIDLVSDSNVSELEITEAEGKVRIVKSMGVAAPVVPAPDDAVPPAGPGHVEPVDPHPGGRATGPPVPGARTEPAVGRRPDLRQDAHGLGLRGVHHRRLQPHDRRLASVTIAAVGSRDRRVGDGDVAPPPRRAPRNRTEGGSTDGRSEVAHSGGDSSGNGGGRDE